jgi:PIN domain nuclease of toxin-antitoxin system
MAKAVLDASALLAWIEGEPGADEVLDLLGSGSAVMSAVNWAEVLAKLVDRGVSEDERRRIRGSLDIEIRPFDEEAAFASAVLRQATSRLGLSIGDRACLGLALLEGVPALTTDRAWSKVDVDVEVRVIR